ncbi:hypothetical protein GCM10018980_00480 [Streptomyces capoamus]|uniref:DUF7144 domain-containing protein n=1 Tax=Streptomyces capoamus TaxID=68183 RepID=A0A919EUB0_9ACTN|nr:hypothetical protein [Streptomyces capoamus]GGW11424.1 hypothetical protein GCM10010501_08530 [Streptomyces libani subsp. rufus]GHG32528.1 hypothetical protein GCM10018980_00480 [Streptomyces capoamus]
MPAAPTASTPTAKQQWATGLTVFAAVMLVLAGMMDIFRGIMAIAQDDVFLATRGYVFRFDLTGWGWIHLILGVVALLVGFGLFGDARWARIGGVAIASLVIIANFLSLPYYPVWSIVLMAFSGFVIWALCVGRRGASGLSD